MNKSTYFTLQTRRNFEWAIIHIKGAVKKNTQYAPRVIHSFKVSHPADPRVMLFKGFQMCLMKYLLMCKTGKGDLKFY